MHHEDAVEGALWRYGTDLADLYRDQMTLRQLWVRIRALPGDSPVHRAVEDARVRAELDQKAQDVDDAIAMVTPPS